MPEPKTGKTRIHLDLVVDDVEQASARIAELGGRSLDERHVHPEDTVAVTADPEGNEFCLVQYRA